MSDAFKRSTVVTWFQFGGERSSIIQTTYSAAKTNVDNVSGAVFTFVREFNRHLFVFLSVSKITMLEDYAFP